MAEAEEEEKAEERTKAELEKSDDSRADESLGDDERRELEELRAKVKRLETERKAAGGLAALAGGSGALITMGPKLSKSTYDLALKVQEDDEKLPPKETARFAAALVDRLMKLGLIGLIVTVTPSILLWQQNGLIESQNQFFQEQDLSIREQIDQQARDTLIVRRAQLLDIIFGEECERPELVRLEAAMNETEDGDGARTTEMRCWPKASARARQEAALAFIEIERGRKVRPDLSEADLRETTLIEADLSGADLTGAVLTAIVLADADLIDADLSGADLFLADLRETTLIEADLSRAVLTFADLTGAKLRQADLRGAHL